MKFDDYQDWTKETALGLTINEDETVGVDDDVLTFLALGLNGEAGEVAEKVKKYRREGDTSYLEDLNDELGDVLWYLARLADEVHLDLSYVAENNQRKLSSRKDRDTIAGEGDDR